jgi:O-antigen/teichoic acid export membrane protein
VKKSLSNQAFFLIVGRIVAYSCTFFVPIALVRIYAKADYGLYQQLLLLYTTFHSILQMGMSSSLLYFYPRDPEKHRELLSQTFWYLSSTGMLFAIILFIFRGAISQSFQAPQIESLIPLTGLYLFFMLISSMLEILLIVEQRAKTAGAVIGGTGALRLLLLVGASLLIPGIKTLILSLLLISIIRVIALLLHIRFQYRGLLVRIRLNYLKTQLRYSIPFGFGIIFFVLNTVVDRYSVSVFFGPEIYAVYAVGCFQLPLMSLFFEPVNNIVLPRLAAYQKEHQIDQLHALWCQTARKLSLLGLPLFMLFLLLSKNLITFLFTSKYSSSTIIFLIFLFLLPKEVLSYGVVLKASGETRMISRAHFISLLITLILLYPAVLLFGFAGPPVAVVISLNIAALFQLARTRQLLHTGWKTLLPWRFLAKIVSSAAVSGVIALVCSTLSGGTAIVNMCITSAVYSFLFIILALRLELVDESDKQMIRTIFSKPFKRSAP